MDRIFLQTPVEASGDEEEAYDSSHPKELPIFSRRVDVIPSPSATQSRRRSFQDYREAVVSLTGRLKEEDGIPNRQARSIIFNFLDERMKSGLGSPGAAIDPMVLQEFEKVVAEQIANSPDDIGLLSVLKEFGWSCSRFISQNGQEFDPGALALALKNLYLKSAIMTHRSGSTSHLSQRVATSAKLMVRKSSRRLSVKQCSRAARYDDEEARQICSFLPDLLLSHLCRRQEVSDAPLSVGSITVAAACMLVDIAGFSKFSGELCSQGLTGLDDLHKATNGFLGHFVDSVYRYKGDGKSWAR
jgi:hypothetical protein